MKNLQTSLNELVAQANLMEFPDNMMPEAQKGVAYMTEKVQCYVEDIEERPIETSREFYQAVAAEFKYLDAASKGKLKYFNSDYAPTNKPKVVKKAINQLELEKAYKEALKSPSLEGKKSLDAGAFSSLNMMVAKRKQSTLSSVIVPQLIIGKNKEGLLSKTAEEIKIPESRLTRALERISILEDKEKEMSLKTKTGTESVSVSFVKEYSKIKDNAIVSLQLSPKPLSTKDEEGQKAYLLSQRLLLKGLKYGGVEYEFCIASDAGKRTQSSVFVRKDLTISRAYIRTFIKEYLTSGDPADRKEFRKLLVGMKKARGMEAVLWMTTYGAYPTSFLDLPHNLGNATSRFGLANSSTKSLGNDFKIKVIGEILTPWNDILEKNFYDYYSGLVDSDGNRLYSDKRTQRVVKNISQLWKDNKIDGQGIIFSDAAIKGFARLGMKLKEEDVLGELIQYRWAGSKGTLLVMNREDFKDLKYPDGTTPYSNCDLIIEESSWKYSPSKFWTGELAPHLELVSVSKSRKSNNFNLQYLANLDGSETAPVFQNTIDEVAENLRSSMENPEFTSALLGLKSKSEMDDTLEFDTHEASMVTTLEKVFEACPEIIRDRGFRIKLINRFTKMRDRMGYGKIPVEGAYRFVNSDPIAFMRTDLAVQRMKDGEPVLDYEGNPLWDIIIRDPSQVALSGLFDCYWGNKEGEALALRSPCQHPGEPQRINMIGDSSIPESIDTPNGPIYARDILSKVKNVVFVGQFSFVLDALGGADTDGDQVLMVVDQNIVNQRSLAREPKLVKLEAKKTSGVVNPKNIREYMTKTLVDNGVGRITNVDMTWRDIGLMARDINSNVNKGKLPYEVVEVLMKCGWAAKDALSKIKDLTPDEKISAERTAALLDAKINKVHYSEWRVAVIKASEANIALARILNETSISTAKTEIAVDFLRYSWLMIKARATWHKPDYPGVKYDSWSQMARVSTHAKFRWDLLRGWAVETSVILPIWKNFDVTPYEDLYRVILAVKASFGKAQNDLVRKYMNSEEDSDARSAEFKELAYEYNLILREISLRVGSISDATAMIYLATNDKDSMDEKGISFIWSCWGEEFASVLQHMKSGEISDRLVGIHMSKKYEAMTLKEGKYFVESCTLYSFSDLDDRLAYCKVPDGVYDVIVYNEIPYLVFSKERRKVEEMATDFKGISLAIVGLKHQIYNGEVLTRAKALELLELADHVIEVRVIDFRDDEGTVKPMAAIFINLPGSDAPVCLGNLLGKGTRKEANSYFANALANKVIRVEIPENSDTLDWSKKQNRELQRVTTTIVDILEDLSI